MDFSSIFDNGDINIVVFVIAQVFGFVAFGFALSSFYFRKKEKILQMQAIDASLYAIHFLLLGGYSACVTKILAIVRSIVVIRKKKSDNLVLAALIVAYFVIAFATFQDLFSLLPPLAGTIYTIALWKTKDEQKIRITALLTYPLWIIYDVHVFSIAGFVAQVVSMTSVFIAIIRRRGNEPTKARSGRSSYRRFLRRGFDRRTGRLRDRGRK